MAPELGKAPFYDCKAQAGATLFSSKERLHNLDAQLMRNTRPAVTDF
jgi:hypothetical protein